MIDHSDNKVHVQNLVTMKEEWIHASLCNQFLYDPNRVDPIGIARRALPVPEFIVEKVLKHKPDDFNFKSKRKDLYFYIQWKGYSEDHNSWEPWENLRKVGVVLEYLRGIKKLNFLIPKMFKNNINNNEDDSY